MTQKFQVGDKVRLKHNVPLYVMLEVRRRRARTIKLITYDASAQHCLYQLGIQGNGAYDYWFRANQLSPANTIIGRPRLKRNYTRKSELSHQQGKLAL